MSTHPSNLNIFTHAMGWMKIFPLKPFSSTFEKFGINTGIIFFCNFDFEPVMYVIIYL